MNKIRIGSNKYMEINIKRFYLPFSIYVECPFCGAEIENKDYLSYPELNHEFSLYLSHYDETTDEDHEFKVDNLILTMSIDISNAIIKKEKIYNEN